MGAGEAAERRWVAIVAPVLLFALALGVRLLPIQNVLIEGRVLFFGSDAYYHMRRIAYSIVHFPRSLAFDPYINFPQGGQPIWTPAFDWSIAAILRPFWGPLDHSDVERIAVFIPPLLGAATVLALYFLARRHFGAGTALLAGAILSVLSGHFWYSQVGFLDHHAAVALVSTCTLAAAMAMLSGASGAGASGSRSWVRAVAAGFGLGVSFLVWPGTLLHGSLIEAGFIGFLLTRPDREAARDFARRLAATHAVAFALVFPAGASAEWANWGRFSPVVLSGFQPWAMAVGAVGSAACAALWRLDSAGASQARRATSAAILGAALLGFSGWTLSGLPAAFGDAWEWFAKTDPFQGQVVESMPLFVQDGAFTWTTALTRLSGFSVFVPFALCGGIALALRANDRAPILLFYVWTIGLCAATLVQRRFFNTASVAVALLFALSLAWMYGGLARRLPQPAARIATAFTALVLLLPVFYAYGWDVSNQIGRLRGRAPLILPQTHRRAVTVEMANWLRFHTPAPSNWMNPEEKPAYGILAPWTIGHILEYEAHRPTVTDNFGDDIGRENFLLARRYYQSGEPAAAELLERLSVRYVVAQRAPNFLGEDPVPGSVFFSLFRRDGSSMAGGPDGAAPALARHRLIFEAQPLPGADPPGEASFKVFEFVAGALVAGTAAPGARIGVTLPARTNRGREFVYTASTVANARGEYAIRLPYANAGGPRSLRVAPSYAFECRGERRSVRVDERSVTRGDRIEGPALCASD